MEYKVRIVCDGKLIEPSDYSKITISNKTIDRIVNDIYERASGSGDGMNVTEEGDGFDMTMCL